MRSDTGQATSCITSNDSSDPCPHRLGRLSDGAGVLTLSEGRKPIAAQLGERRIVENDDCVLLRLLVKASESRRILEIGSNKRSYTLQLAQGAAAVGGKITAVGFTQGCRRRVTQRLNAAGLAQCVDFRAGHLLYALPRLNGPFDLVLLDLYTGLYPRCLKIIAPLLADSALLVSRNLGFLGSSSEGAKAYRSELDRLGLQSLRLHIADGFAVSMKP